MAIDLKNKVAIVTGAGGGLGRQHALALAKRGARVVVNDLGGAVDGRGGSVAAAEAVAQEIRAAGGEAIANSASVTEYAEIEAMVAEVTELWGGIDILVANAGILRDRTFAKMELDDFRAVFEVHVMGTVNCVKAVWDSMRARNYGRIVFTTSSSGLWGNFGQSNYGAAKMALVGLMNTLALEGAKYNVRVNCLAPTAATRMLEGLMPDEMLQALDPALVSPAVVALAAEEAPTKTIVCAGAGGFEVSEITLSQGVHYGATEDAADQLLAQFAKLKDRKDQLVPGEGSGQGGLELKKAGFQIS